MLWVLSLSIFVIPVLCWELLRLGLKSILLLALPFYVVIFGPQLCFALVGVGLAEYRRQALWKLLAAASLTSVWPLLAFWFLRNGPNPNVFMAP